MKNLANVANEIIDIWADDLKFSNGLARTFFAETVYHALRIAYRWGARSEARKRKVSASARYQKRLTKRAPDAANVCRVINHFYVDGVCSQCGSKEPPRG